MSQRYMVVWSPELEHDHTDRRHILLLRGPT
jgi:hypothetical protein